MGLQFEYRFQVDVIADSTDAYRFFDGSLDERRRVDKGRRVLTTLRREEIQVVSKALYMHDRNGNTEPNMLLRTQLVLHSEGILNSPL